MKSLGGFDFGDGGLGGFHHVLGGDAEVDEVLSTVPCRPNCSMETGLP